MKMAEWIETCNKIKEMLSRPWRLEFSNPTHGTIEDHSLPCIGLLQMDQQRNGTT